MDELMDMIVSDESPSQITDAIKDLLFAKSAEKVDAFKPVVANSYVDSKEDEISSEEESGE
jgi:hypothetical protein|tara:strand:- start:7064 stop:7246 length:183 start_codon:yes stop_codon:yes gene_type:complete